MKKGDTLISSRKNNIGMSHIIAHIFFINVIFHHLPYSGCVYRYLPISHEEETARNDRKQVDDKKYAYTG